MVVIDVTNIVSPLFFIFIFVVGWYPDAKNVVDVAFVEEKVGGILPKDSVLVDGEEEVGVGGSWWCSHCCSSELVPVCVPEEEDIVAHHNGERFNEGVGGDRGEAATMLVEVLCYLNDGHASVDVSIHRGGVGSEEFSTGWEGG